ncbi:MAG: hypothetical protein AB1801_00265 [Chloroflexota bacterium]
MQGVVDFVHFEGEFVYFAGLSRADGAVEGETTAQQGWKGQAGDQGRDERGLNADQVVDNQPDDPCGYHIQETNQQGKAIAQGAAKIAAKYLE